MGALQDRQVVCDANDIDADGRPAEAAGQAVDWTGAGHNMAKATRNIPSNVMIAADIVHAPSCTAFLRRVRGSGAFQEPLHADHGCVQPGMCSPARSCPPSFMQSVEALPC